MVSEDGCSRQKKQQKTRALTLDEFGNEKIPMWQR